MDDDELNVSNQYHFDPDGHLVCGPKPMGPPIWSMPFPSEGGTAPLTPSGDHTHTVNSGNHTHTVKQPSAFMSEVLRQQAEQLAAQGFKSAADTYDEVSGKDGSFRVPYVDTHTRRLLSAALLDMERLIQALWDKHPLPKEEVFEIARRWQVPVEKVPYPTAYCDDCGEGVPSNKACFVGSLPIPVSSAGVGQSATLCLDCFEEVEPHLPKGVANGNV